MAVPCKKGEFLTIPQIIALLRQAGYSENLIVPFTALILYESNGCPTASNKIGEYSIGLLQMNMKAHGTKFGTEQQLYNALWNVTQALKLFKMQGFPAWKNSYNKYKNNYQGITARVQAIYNGVSTSVLDTAQIKNVMNNTHLQPKPQSNNNTIYGILAVVLLLAVT